VTAFKEYAAIASFKGSLLKDPDKLLVAPGKNSQAARQVRFTSTREITELEPVLKSYILEAIEVLTPGRQRGYIIYFSQPKQSGTRISRIEKCVQKILDGKGFNDRY